MGPTRHDDGRRFGTRRIGLLFPPAFGIACSKTNSTCSSFYATRGKRRNSLAAKLSRRSSFALFSSLSYPHVWTQYALASGCSRTPHCPIRDCQSHRSTGTSDCGEPCWNECGSLVEALIVVGDAVFEIGRGTEVVHKVWPLGAAHVRSRRGPASPLSTNRLAPGYGRGVSSVSARAAGRDKS